jgi:predicted dinucleotide-binding enzyme
MKVAILGAGNVGRTLGTGLAAAGHEILYAVREPDAPKNAALAGERSRALPVRDAVAAADVVVLATPWSATEAALASAGDFGGKPLLDATNPIGPGFVLTHGHTDSGGEQVQRWAPSAKVVKAFNTTGLENMADPRYGDARAAMFVCGDDADACAVALRLAGELGFEAVRVGGLDRARVLEPAAVLWISLAMSPANGRNIAFGLLRRGVRS